MSDPQPTPRHLYFMGICGTAMGSVAAAFRERGYRVTGSDASVYDPMKSFLEGKGISILDGYRAEHLPADVDRFVIGNAQSRGNPEVEEVLRRKLPYVSLPELLRDEVLRGRRNFVVSGTHGKTTTASLLAWLLEAGGLRPGFVIGGLPANFEEGARFTDSGINVIEGDEYDSAFFDKRSKFIHYAPHVAVLNNLEFDHADIFRDLADVQRTFSHLTRLVPRRGFLVLNGDDPHLAALPPTPWTQRITVGVGEANDVRLHPFEESPAGTSFALAWRGRPWGQPVHWTQPGLFNARNAAMAATAAGLALHPDDPTRLDLAPLARFRGVRRRQEILASRPGLTVIEDFGHHPTALAETFRSLRQRHPGARLTAVFEPRSNTARTRVLQADFTRALALADEIHLGAVNRSDKLRPDEVFDADTVRQALAAQGLEAHAWTDNLALLAALETSVAAPQAPARLIVFFSNGSFDGIIPRLAARVG
jgi:UDP-N-acetylmuramate: L-alanyl-gamma-D-glutamyl-meso-diaminopimelate ligase